jgi:hypothetical protein
MREAIRPPGINQLGLRPLDLPRWPIRGDRSNNACGVRALPACR